MALACALVVTSPGSATATASSSPEPVTGWLDVTLKEIAAHRTNPPRAARALALVSVALDRAAGRSPALHGAAAAVLGYLYPDRAAAFDARAEQLAGSEHALAPGRAIGATVVQRAEGDDSDATYTGTRLTGLGYWTEPPGVGGPLESAAGQWQTWNIRSGSALRPPPPLGPAHGAAYAAQVQAVYDTSSSLTPGQRESALFWADGAGTETPPGHWTRIAIGLIDGAGLSAPSAAHVLGVLNTAQADAFIACWDAKFAYWSERPNQAIRRELDPGWASLIATPPFPAYPSGHSTTSAAASRVLGAFFPRDRRELAGLAEDAAISRLYGGIHFPMDNAAGLKLGKKVGRRALRRYAAWRF